MTVNRTTLLDLPLPVTGTEAGTWGDTTNNGLSQYMDIAIAGMNSLTSANFTAGALTIANTQGDSSATNIAAGSAQYATIKVSSLAVNSTITAPSSNRSYRIINADATYSLTIKASGQTGVTFLPGQTGVVAFNGTDYVIVGVVGAGTATDNAVARFDGTTGEIIQNSVVTIADSTGDVAGVGTLTMGGNLTLNGGTANGVLYLNGSKVATSGSALVFDGTNFSTTGTATATKLIPTGGAATGNGMYLPAANTLAWSNNGAETMRLDSSGNLGLGVTPSAWGGAGKALQMTSGSSVAANGAIGINSNAYYDGSVNKYITTNPATQYVQGSGVHYWYTAPSGTAGNTISFTQAMTLDASGNLQIGNTSYAYRVAASRASDGIVGYFRRDGSTVNPALTISCNETGNTVGFGTDYAGATSPAMTFSTGGTERARIDSSGNLGLGVTPSAWSGYTAMQFPYGGSIAGYNGSAAPILALSSNAYHVSGVGDKYVITGPASRYLQNQGVHQWFNAASGTAGDTITFTQAMTLDASGTLLVGRTSSPLAAGAKVAIASSGDAAYQLTKDGVISARLMAVTSGLAFGVDGSDGATERARITSGGDLLVGTTSSGTLNGRVAVAGTSGNASIGTLSGSGTGALDTGISINQSNGGACIVLIASRNTSAGTNTEAAVYIVRFYYDGNNAPTTVYVGGSANFVTFGTSGSNTLTLTNAGGGNVNYSWFGNR